MSKYSKAILSPRTVYYLTFLLAGGACAVMTEEPIEPEPLGSAQLASKTSDNGVALPNGLNLPNGFNLGNGTSLTNGFNLSNGTGGGTANGIDVVSGSIAPPSNSDLDKWLDVNPTMRRRTIKYLTQCALPSTKSVALTHNGTTETYTGVLNLGPGWATSGTAQMSTAEQEKVSACMLARINTAGAIVNINLIGPDGLKTGDGWNTRTSTDNTNYPTGEAAFAGNIFLNPPKAFACGNGTGPFSSVPANPSIPSQVSFCGSRACDDNASGTCTNTTCQQGPNSAWFCTGTCGGIVKFHTDCGNICSQSYTSPYSSTYYTSCVDPQNSVTWSHVMTSYIMRYGYDHNCSGDWECTSQSCGIPWYGGTQTKCL